jgi:hypothetical protein
MLPRSWSQGAAGDAKEEGMKGITIIRRAAGTLLAITALAAVVAPVAQADPWQLERASQLSDAGDRDDTTRPAGGALGDAVDRYVANNPEPIVDAVDRYLANDRAHSPRSLPDAIDRYLANDRVHNPQPITSSAGRFVLADHSERIAGDSPFTVAASAPEPSSGLDWDAFGFGLGLGIAACALAAVAVLSFRRRKTLVHA